MKKFLVLASLVGLLVLPVTTSATTCPSHSPVVCILSISPNPIPAGTPTVVTVTAAVTDPNFNPTSLNLLKVTSVGKTLAILGTFNDNGVNGDQVAGDGILTVQVTLNETSDVYLRATAGIKGKIMRVLSSVETLTVQ